MKRLTRLYILWGIICCMNVCFILREVPRTVGYTLEGIAPSDIQTLDLTLVAKPGNHAPDTLVNTRTGEPIQVAFGQARQMFWHADSFQSLPWALRLAGSLSGIAALLLVLLPYRWSNAFFRNIRQGDFFTADNERLLRRFGYFQLAGVGLLAVFRFVEFLGLRAQLDFEYYRVGFEWFSLLAYAIPPACSLFAAEAFRIGVQLQKDSEGLV